jgi:cell division protein FtsZ
MMGRGEASGPKRVLNAAVAAISNPLIEDPSIKRASGLIVSITGGRDLTLFEVDEAATRIRDEADPDANIIVGATFDASLEGVVRVSVVATGIDNLGSARERPPAESSLTDLASRLSNDRRRTTERIERSVPPPQFANPPSLIPAARTAKPIPEHARPTAPQRLDPFGRAAPVRNPVEEKILDIPAFLSRKAN